jgi:hypothetical protein
MTAQAKPTQAVALVARNPDITPWTMWKLFFEKLPLKMD